MLTKEELEKRRQYICSTDISAIMGLNSYKSAFDVWDEKVNGTYEDISDKPSVKWGSILEPIIAEQYSKRTGIEICKGHFVGDLYKRRGSSFDYLYKDFSQKTILEIKTAGWNTRHLWGETGTDYVPDQYNIQCQWQMGILGWDKTVLVLLFGGQEERDYLVKRHDGLIENCFAVAKDFWDKYIETKEMPPPTGHKKENEYLNRILIPKDREIIQANTECVEVIDSYRELRAKKKSLEKELLRHEALLKKEIGDRGGIDAHETRITWYADKNGKRRFMLKE